MCRGRSRGSARRWRSAAATAPGSIAAAGCVPADIAGTLLARRQSAAARCERAELAVHTNSTRIFALARSGRSRAAPAAVGAYIGAAYFFTSSTSFANPAITIGRMFSDTFAGITPSSAPAFIAAQIIGGLAALVVIKALYPHITPAQAAEIVVPHQQDQAAAARAAHDGAAAPAPGPASPPPGQP
jgi:Major intrinsic protein